MKNVKNIENQYHDTFLESLRLHLNEGGFSFFVIRDLSIFRVVIRDLSPFHAVIRENLR